MLSRNPDAFEKSRKLHFDQFVPTVYLRDSYGSAIRYDRPYDTRCYFNVGSKADMSQLNLPRGTNN